MRIHATVVAVAVAMALSVLACRTAPAQAPFGPQQAVYSPALFNQAQGQLVDAHGAPAVIPASYCDSCGGCPPGYCGGYGGAYPCEDAFCGAGTNCEQCGPHYFDASLEFLMYQRADYGNSNQTFATLNVLPGGTAVLTDNDLESDYEAGFRVTGRYDIGGLSFLEFGYSSFWDMGGAGLFTDPTPVSATQGNLFSPFTNFGQNPAGGIPVNAGNFDQTDRAVAASVSIESTLMTAEISYRRYWVGHSPRVSGAWLWGFRYTRLKDEFNYRTQANGTFRNYVEAENDLAGFQFGSDAWVCLRQGLRAGLEGKAGIYGNDVNVINRASTSPVATVNINEVMDQDEVSFIGELRLMMVADICPSWSVKCGYEVLILTSVATSLDNFNPASPYNEGQGSPRQPLFNSQGDALFHGFQVAAEYVW
ncbi:MAG: BBP7 family outer membrane beta-barrel protein [Planctomycetales bacterium]|nr:BBP7 family outer membrane beta-barrel protein [Planctomycetales bacterium]